MSLGKWLVHKRGLLSNFDLIVNPQVSRLKPRSMQAIESDEEVEAGIFSRRLECPDVFEAMESIASFYGFSGVEPNTVIMGWADNEKNVQRLPELIKRYVELDLNLLLLHIDPDKNYGKHASIDVWWRGGKNNISLMLALLRFLTASDAWAAAKIRFLVINEGETAHSDAIRSRLDGILETYRINATTQVINNVVGRKPVNEIIGYESLTTDLTIIGLPMLSTLNTTGYFAGTQQLIDKLGTTLLVRASSFFNDLSVGIETSLQEKAPRETKSAVQLDRPALTLPENETLRWALQNLSDKADAISLELTDQPFVALGNIHRDMGQEVHETIMQTFQTLSRTLEKQDRPRARKVVQRTHATLAFHAQKILSTFANEQLPIQQKLLNTTVLNLRSQARGLVRQSPEELKQIIDPQTDNSENSASIWGRLFNRPRTITIPFKDFVEVKVNEDYHKLVGDAVEQLCGSAHVFTENILLQLQNTFDALQRIERSIDAGEPTKDILKEEQQKIDQELKEMLEAHAHRQTQLRSNLLVGTRQLIQSVANEVDAA